MSRKPTRSEREHWAFRYGTDRQFLEWLSYQPSCVDGRFNQWQDGFGRNIACHVRTVRAGAGVGFKPPFSAVPLTDAQHRLTHQHGNSVFGPPEWWQRQVELHVERWAASRQSR